MKFSSQYIEYAILKENELNFIANSCIFEYNDNYDVNIVFINENSNNSRSNYVTNNFDGDSRFHRFKIR